MTESIADLRTLTLLWLSVAVFIIVRQTRPRRNVGLVLSYVLSLMAMHWFASALYLLPWYDSPARDLSIVGLRESFFAVLAFGIGAEISRLWIASPDYDVADDPSKAVASHLINLYIVSGVVMYGLLFTVAATLPSASAVLSGGSALMAVGLGLKLWNARQLQDKAYGHWWLVVAFAFPLVSVLAQGFLGYGFAALMIVLAFRSSFHGLTIKSLAFGLVLVFLGLTIYTTYMRDRSLIREVVWTGGSVADRARQVQLSLASAEWFDFTNRQHLDRVDARLNQNYLVGAAVVYMRGRMVKPANGETIRDAALAMIPRALWPDKPVVGGSGDLVTRFTGLQFAEGTSIGVGHVIEWYVNFGRLGVVVGFGLMGLLLATADQKAAYALSHRDTKHLLLWYLPTLNCLQVGGSLAEMAAGAAAAFLFAHALNRIAERLWSSERQVEESIPIPQVELR